MHDCHDCQGTQVPEKEYFHSVDVTQDIFEDFSMMDFCGGENDIGNMEMEVLCDISSAFVDAFEVTMEEEGLTLPCHVSFTLTTKNKMQKINKEQRGVDKTTDVLSFPSYEFQAGVAPNDPKLLDPDSQRLFLGDVVISLNHCIQQGKEFGNGTVQEALYLMVHSFLHLLGYDHLDEAEKKEIMRQREKHILAQEALQKYQGGSV